MRRSAVAVQTVETVVDAAFGDDCTVGSASAGSHCISADIEGGSHLPLWEPMEESSLVSSHDVSLEIFWGVVLAATWITRCCEANEAPCPP